MLAVLLAGCIKVGEPLGVGAFLPTGDGAEVHVRHAPGDGPVVLLCHGISSNGRFWDLEPHRSLVRYLHDRGYDVWNLDLRGHGDALRTEAGSRQRDGWTVDDYGMRDLPAAITYVREQTGAERIHYVGHSMGGMVLAVYLANTPEPPLASAVLVGSPLDFRDPDLLLEALMNAGGPVMKMLPTLPTPALARVAVPFRRSMVLGTDTLLHNPDNMARRPEARMLASVVSPLSRGEVEQFALARQGGEHPGEFQSMDGSVLYRQALGDVSVPMLFVAGRADRIVSPDRVKAYFDAVGSTDKAFLMASRANGMHADYGHLDLGLGDHVEEDLFVPIEAWLAEHP
ncbi:MAG: alpha/beta hydrolase [Myxococcota bacterium]